MANMPNSLSLDDWQICEDFRQAWSSGAQPHLAGYLTRCREAGTRAALFWNLLELDLEYRHQRGEVPRFEDYGEFATEFPDALHHFLSLPAEPPGREQSASASIPQELRNHQDYLLLRELGRGGMGVVYLARNRLMDRLEALKVVNRERLDQVGATDRFLREIRTAARLSHPNVVTAYSALQLGDLLVFVMEYVEGEDLAKVVATHGPLSVPAACSYVVQAARGLDHAHEHGLIHRDIKPANLILTRRGKEPSVKILDFGLAKANREAVAETGLTGTGIMLGTPDYVAPEQTHDAAGADIRSDIYSLGCTLYFLLGGRPPFRGGGVFATLAAHVSTTAKPLNQVRADVPEELAAVVARMMAKDPDERYRKPVEVVRALTPFANATRAVRAGAEGLSKEAVDNIAQAGRETDQGGPPGVPARHPPVPATITDREAPEVDSLKDTDRRPSTHLVVPQAESSQRQQAPRSRKAESKLRERGGRRKLWLVAAGGTGILVLGLAVLVVALGQGQSRETDKQGAEKREQPTAAKVSKPGDVWTNQLGMKFAFVPAGSFWMGGGGGAAGDKRVTIGDDFYLGVYPVTQGEWRLLMADANPTPSYFARRGAGWEGFGWQAVNSLSDADLDSLPVEQVPWDDVQEFLSRLNRREPGGDWIYRLPRETEWEYACRGAGASKEECSYHFYFKEPTNDLSSDKANFKGSLPVGNGKNEVDRRRTTKVGSFEPNRLGLFDMHGNVWQWCHDDQGTGRVYRGGSWAAPGFECRAANRRIPPVPSHRHCVIGFRIARVPAR